MGKVINLNSYSGQKNPFRALMEEVREQLKELMNIEGIPTPALKLFELIPEHVLPSFLDELVSFKSETGIKIAILLERNYKGEVRKFAQNKLRAVLPKTLKEIENAMYNSSNYEVDKYFISRSSLKGKLTLMEVSRDKSKFGFIFKTLLVDIENMIFKDFDVIYSDGDMHTSIRKKFGDVEFVESSKEEISCIVNSIVEDYSREKEDLPNYREVISDFQYNDIISSNECFEEVVLSKLEKMDSPSYTVNTFYYGIIEGKSKIIMKLFNDDIRVPTIVKKLGGSQIVKTEIIDQKVSAKEALIRSNCYVETQDDIQILKYALIFSLFPFEGQWYIEKIEIDYNEVVLSGDILNEGDSITNIGIYYHDSFEDIVTFLELFVEGMELSGEEKYIKSIIFEFDPRKSDIDINKNLRNLIIVSENELIISSKDNFEILKELISFNPLGKKLKVIQSVQLTMGVIFEYVYSEFESLQEFLFEDNLGFEENYILYFDFNDMEKMRIFSNRRIDIFIINIMNIVCNILVKSGVKEGTAIKYSKYEGLRVREHYESYVENGRIELLDVSAENVIKIREIELMDRSPLKDGTILNNFYKEILLMTEKIVSGFEDIKKYKSKAEVLRYNCIIGLIEYFDDLILESDSDIVINHDFELN